VCFGVVYPAGFDVLRKILKISLRGSQEKHEQSETNVEKRICLGTFYSRLKAMLLINRDY